MTDVDIETVGGELARLVEQALMGDDIVISRAGVAIAQIVRSADAPLPPRQLGVLEGRMRIPADFDDPLPADLLDAFDGCECRSCSTPTS